MANNGKLNENAWGNQKQKVINKIKKLILVSGMSPSQIAKSMKISPSTINRMYREDHLTPKMANALSEYFGFDNFINLLDSDEEMKSKDIVSTSKDEDRSRSVTMILLKDIQNKVSQLIELNEK